MYRQCDSYCGWGDAYCCSAGQVCTTDTANVAACVPTAQAGGGDGGGWSYYTTTIVDSVNVPTTRVVTSSAYIGQAAASQPYVAQSTAICFAPTIACGTICCASNQECHGLGNCIAKQGGDGSGSQGAPGQTSLGAASRPTSITVTTLPVTTTQGFVAPVETTGTTEPLTSGLHKTGLSGGAIAGIVIGVIAGVIMLLLILACCCLGAGVKGIWHLIVGKPKDDRRGSRTEVIETRRHSTRYGGSTTASRRETHGGWFGGAAAGKSNSEKHDRHKKEAVGLAGIGLALAALWAGLKFKKNKEEDRRQRRSSTYYSSYSESYTGTSDSE